MAIINLPNITSEKFRAVSQTKSAIFQIPSIAGMSLSDQYSFELQAPQIMLEGIRVKSDSTKFDLSLRSKKDIILPDIREFLTIIDIDKFYAEMKMGIFVTNEDIPEVNKYYCVIDNRSSIATGLIDLELIYSRM